MAAAMDQVSPGFLGSPWRNLLAGVTFVLLVMVAATAAYVFQGWSVPDAIYMVVMTVYTVGYGEVRPVATPELRAITIALIVFGCTGMLFVTGALVQLITASQFAQYLGSRRMGRDVERLQGHVVVCGYGRIGQQLAREMAAARGPFVVVERTEARVAEAVARGYLTVRGDATDESCLMEAGVVRARALATVLPEDAANVFITLSARSLNPKLTIIARGEAPSTERKLLQAGADHVVLPTHIGAERIAELILYRDLAKGLEGEGDTAARELERLGLELEVIPAAARCWAEGRSLAAVEAEAAGAFLIVGLHRRDAADLLRPAPDTLVQPGDAVALGGRTGRAAAVARLLGEPAGTGAAIVP